MIDITSLRIGGLAARSDEELAAPVSSPAGAVRDPASLVALIEAAADLAHRGRAAAEEIHIGEGLLAGQRGILRGLDRSGPQTVPQMARARPVSRQHVQALVNPLAERGYVEFIDNPAHKRSRLVRLTAIGEKLLAAINRREERVLGALRVRVSDRDLRTATGVLRAVGEALADRRWGDVLEARPES